MNQWFKSSNKNKKNQAKNNTEFWSSAWFVTHLISILIGFRLYQCKTQKVHMMIQVKSNHSFITRSCCEVTDSMSVVLNIFSSTPQLSNYPLCQGPMIIKEVVKTNVFIGKFTDQAFQVVECVRAHTPVKIEWCPPGCEPLFYV